MQPSVSKSAIRMISTRHLRIARLAISTGRGSAEDCASRKVKDMVWFTDFSGNRFELVVRPLNSGWRYFPSRDAGIPGLADVISVPSTSRRTCRSGPACSTLSPRLAGDAVYLRFDRPHHRIACSRPTARHPRVEYAVEDVNLLMRNYYVLRDLQVARPAWAGTPSCVRAAVCDVRRARRCALQLRDGRCADDGQGHRPRQFPAGPAGLCGWGSECKIAEFNDAPNGRIAGLRTEHEISA